MVGRDAGMGELPELDGLDCLDCHTIVANLIATAL